MRRGVLQAAFLAPQGRSKRLRGAGCGAGAGARRARWARGRACRDGSGRTRRGFRRGGESKARRYAPPPAASRVSCAARALETLARCGLRGWCGRTARAVGAGTRLPRQERARAAGLPTGRGRMARRYAPLPAASRVSCAARALETLAPSALRSPQRRPMPQRAVKGQGPFDISERRPSPYRAQRGRPLTAAERANQHERSTKTPCSN